MENNYHTNDSNECDVPEDDITEFNLDVNSNPLTVTIHPSINRTGLQLLLEEILNNSDLSYLRSQYITELIERGISNYYSK